MPPVKRKDLRLPLLLGALALVALVALWVARRPPTRAQVAARFRDCVIAADGPCVLSLLTEEELQDHRVTGEAMSGFLKEFVAPLVRDARPTRETVETLPAGQETFSWVLVGEGTEFPLSVRVSDTHEGPRVVNGIVSLVLTSAAAENGRVVTDRRRLRLWRDRLRQWHDRLTGYGLVGYRPRPDGPLLTWREAAGDIERRLQGPPKPPAPPPPPN